MPEFLADHALSFVPCESKFKQLGHAILFIAIPQPMRSGRPPEHGFAGFVECQGKIETPGKVIVLPISDAPVNDGSRFVETNAFRRVSQISR